MQTTFNKFKVDCINKTHTSFKSEHLNFNICVVYVTTI